MMPPILDLAKQIANCGHEQGNEEETFDVLVDGLGDCLNWSGILEYLEYLCLRAFLL
jgi:hypothetical protein